MKTLSKIGNTILNILLVLVIVGGISIAYTSATSGKPSVFGYRAIHVVSGSMEPVIMTDQFVLGKITDGDDVQIGDIIAYKEKGVLKRTIIHRVIEMYEEDGTTYYIFKGDNNDERDPDPVTADMFLYKIIWY